MVNWVNNNYWFIGQVKNIEGNNVTLEFIHQTSPDVNCFKLADDVDSVNIDDIFLEVCQPTPLSSSRCSTFRLSDEDFKAVLSSYENLFLNKVIS